MLILCPQKSAGVVNIGAVKLMAVVEKQALLEALIQLIPDNLENRDSFCNVSSLYYTFMWKRTFCIVVVIKL